jgi:hypothetical protein
MLTTKRLLVSVAVLCWTPLAVHGSTVIVPVEADTYLLHGGTHFGYPDSPCIRATSWVWADSLFRFDLSGLDGYTAENIMSATFRVYTGQGFGGMASPMAEAGILQQAQVVALRTWNPETHPHELTYWTEAPQGDYANGYIDGSEGSTAHPNLYDPGDVGGVDPYETNWSGGVVPITGGPSVIMSHDTGPDTWASVDLTDFVKAWLPGGDLEIANNGIRIHDLADNYGWYFFGKDYDSTQGAYGLPDHPGAEYVPYLEVEAHMPIRIPGDANLSGTVDDVDAAILAEHWGIGPGAEWGMGDFTGDGFVNVADASILAANWGATNGQTESTVPEPAAVTMLAVVLCAGLQRRPSSSFRVYIARRM